MEKAMQLTVTMENVPGQLGRLCRILSQASVNLRGISVSDAADVSVIRLCVSDPSAAKTALREAGVSFVAQEVLLLEVDDKPGVLEQVAARLGEAKVNVRYVYGSSDGGKRKTVLILKVDDPDRARQALA
ncbi:MAG TPA: ACT domain-containing protein [Phycisphaerae bacterium]|nr:ACT domain-containing protein [Phycisphaerae bacterium]